MLSRMTAEGCGAGHARTTITVGTVIVVVTTTVHGKWRLSTRFVMLHHVGEPGRRKNANTNWFTCDEDAFP